MSCSLVLPDVLAGQTGFRAKAETIANEQAGDEMVKTLNAQRSRLLEASEKARRHGIKRKRMLEQFINDRFEVAKANQEALGSPQGYVETLAPDSFVSATRHRDRYDFPRTSVPYYSVPTTLNDAISSLRDERKKIDAAIREADFMVMEIDRIMAKLQGEESTRQVTDLAKDPLQELQQVVTESRSFLDSMDAELTKQSGESQEEGWVSLFNGKDLEGWTPKIRGYDLGDNYANTFRVEDGLLKVGYKNYEDGFQRRFGHLFYKEKLSHYLLRVEYRFVGQQVEGGPGWALRNSGVMLHCQDPASIPKDQDFPVSIEMQMLGGDGTNARPNANLCTPGTHVEMKGDLFTPHCVNSSSQTYHGEQWVTVEMEVRGDEVIRHKLDGKVVLEYQKPQYDPNDETAKPLIKDGNVALTEGYFSLQSESHPIEFRKVELKKLATQ